MSVDQNSKLYVMTTSAVAKALSAQITSTGAPAFEQLGPLGGNIFPGVPLVVSDAVSSGQLIVFDAAQLATNPGTVAIDITNEATLQMDTAPDSPPSTSTIGLSLFQQGLVGLRAERYFGCERLRDGAVAIITGFSSGDSPN